MKKKIISFVVVLGLSTLMVASNFTVEAAKTAPKASKAAATDTDTAQNAADGKLDESDFAVEIKGVTVKMGDDMNTLLNSIGEPDAFTQARSCLYDGDDKVYEYGGITIYTYPSGKKDIVYIAEFNGTEPTLSGIVIGSTKEAVAEAYGEEYTTEGTYMIYQLNENQSLAFQFIKDKVSYIEIYAE